MRLRFQTRSAQITLLGLAVLTFMGAGDSSGHFNNLGHRMMCTCGCGQVLLECNHVGCQSSDKMRNELQAALDSGDKDDLILQEFVQEYGPTVIATPTAKGLQSHGVDHAVRGAGVRHDACHDRGACLEKQT
jgi:cytochrome c-type biogenesis protein CcmH